MSHDGEQDRHDQQVRANELDGEWHAQRRESDAASGAG